MVLEKFIRKLIKQDFSLNANLSLVSSVNIAFGAVKALTKNEIINVTFGSGCNRDE